MSPLTIDEGITLAGNFYPGPIEVEVTKYLDPDGGLAIALITREDGYPDLLSKVTVNLSATGHQPIPGAVFVKDYSENEGMLDAFEKKGWMQRTGRVVQNGFVEIREAMVIGALREAVDRKARLK